MRTRTKIVAGAAAVATATALALSTAGAAGAAPNARAALAGSVPPWASSAAFKGAAVGTDHVGFRVYLGWRGGDAAARLATAVSTPGNALYGKFLTSAQFRAQFAPTQADVTAVQSWLRGAGFTVDYTPTNNHYVAAEGTVAQAAAAFGTSFGEYAVAGQVLRAPESTLTVPSSLAASVEGVIGLDETAALVHTDHIVADAPPSAGFRNATPCSAYWNEQSASVTGYTDPVPYAPCGYTPNQIRGAYGLTDPNGGSGVTVAIIDAYASPTIASDVNRYSEDQGLPHPVQLTQLVAPGTYHVKDNRAQSPSGWYGEETLDIEAVHTTAPGAKIVYVGAPNNYQDLDAALNHVVDRHLASIVTNSYGWSTELLPRGYVKPYEDTIVQGAATGIGIYFSSGDNGDETGGNPANAAAATPDWPAVSPFVTAVGGTSLAVGLQDKYLFETGWETGRGLTKDTAPTFTFDAPTYLYGSGGGTSRIFAQPSYQAGVVPTSISQKGGRAVPMRTVPDVSMLGDPNTGFLMGQTQTFPDGAYYDTYRIGGTSLSSPLMAGVMASAQAAANKVIGFANPLLYANATTGALRDIKASDPTLAVVRSDFVNGVGPDTAKKFSLRMLSFDGGLTIKTGDNYDDVTGIGSPTDAFIDAVVAATP